MPGDVELRIARRDGGAEIVIPSAARVAELFFSLDPSSRDPANSYDAQAGSKPANAIRSADVDVLNGPMRARTPKAKWDDLLAQHHLGWLAAVPEAWDLIEMTEDEWQTKACSERVEEALLGILAPYRNVSVATKMLHFKRPGLFPVLDKLVVEQLGAHISSQAKIQTRARQAREVIEHVREQGRRNREQLTAVTARLTAAGRPRPLVRILDALVWTSHESSLTYPVIDVVDRWARAGSL